MRHRECRHNRHQRAEPPERNHQAKQEQQVVGSLQNVQEPQVDEGERRLIPDRIQIHHPGIGLELKRPHAATRQHIPQDRQHPYAKPPQPARRDRKVRFIGMDRVLEGHIEQRLVPHHIRLWRQRRPGDFLVRLVV
jgi:hypothetical protein